jgi:hypothetical protein
MRTNHIRLASEDKNSHRLWLSLKRVQWQDCEGSQDYNAETANDRLHSERILKTEANWFHSMVEGETNECSLNMDST